MPKERQPANVMNLTSHPLLIAYVRDRQTYCNVQ
jgi:hypothetical protein